MPAGCDPSALSIGIRLANGQQVRLCPTDSGSAEVIRRLAGVMQLSPVSSGPELFITVRRVDSEKRAQNQSPLVCTLPPGTNEMMRVIQMTDLSKAIAIRTFPTGGLLIHGALAERDGYGIILAAPGGTGKTTASNRLPSPWHSLSDDATLVVRNGDGTYYAHSWPTWSRFRDNGPGGSWDVERAVPLAAIFFLSRSDLDRAEPMDARDAVAYLAESVHQVTGIPGQPGCTWQETAELCKQELAAASALAETIPAYQLLISQTGAFWEEIVAVLDQRKATRAGSEEDKSSPSKNLHGPGFSGPETGMFGPGHHPVVYSGPSMNPTLRAPDLMDVVPCGRETLVIGDIICFTRPGDEQMIIHRIIGITGTGIRTQGDNNPVADSGFLHADQILGRVTGATRGNHTRKIAGGTFGRIIHRWMRTRSSVLKATGKILHLVKPALVITRASSRLLPGRIKPRIVLFTSRNTRIMRLYFGRSVAGEFSPARGVWTIRFPFRLLVDETDLPAMNALNRFIPDQLPTSR